MSYFLQEETQDLMKAKYAISNTREIIDLAIPE